MVNILGTITDSTGTPVNGTLTFKLPVFVIDDNTNPDTVYTTTPHTFNITAGVVNVQIPPTTEPGIAYRITFFQTGITDPTLDFSAVIADVATIQLSLLLPTGITATSLDTSAYRTARAIAKDSVLSQLFKQPSISSLTLTGASTPTFLRSPKPFAGAIKIKALSVFSTSGWALWDFEVGIIKSDGTEETLTAASTTSNTASGRFYELALYDQTAASTIMGFFIKANPRAGAAVLSATLTISFIEI